MFGKSTIFVARLRTETSMTLKVEIEEMMRARAFALSTASEAGLDERRAKGLQLIVEEAVVNVINYSGATTMELDAWQENGCLYLSVTDDGTPFDPTQYPSPDLSVPGEQRQIGGLGIHYIRKMSDGMTYRREDGRNILTILIKLRTEN